MKPINFRNATFWSLRGELDGLRGETYEAWRKHGPGTTREVAQKSGISLLTLRPRTTELVQLGLVEVVESGERTEMITLKIDAPAGEGLYAVVSPEKWERWREDQVNRQMQLI